MAGLSQLSQLSGLDESRGADTGGGKYAYRMLDRLQTRGYDWGPDGVLKFHQRFKDPLAFLQNIHKMCRKRQLEEEKSHLEELGKCLDGVGAIASLIEDGGEREKTIKAFLGALAKLGLGSWSGELERGAEALMGRVAEAETLAEVQDEALRRRREGVEASTAVTLSRLSWQRFAELRPDQGRLERLGRYLPELLSEGELRSAADVSAGLVGVTWKRPERRGIQKHLLRLIPKSAGDSGPPLLRNLLRLSKPCDQDWLVQQLIQLFEDVHERWEQRHGGDGGQTELRRELEGGLLGLLAESSAEEAEPLGSLILKDLTAKGQLLAKWVGVPLVMLLGSWEKPLREPASSLVKAIKQVTDARELASRSVFLESVFSPMDVESHLLSYVASGGLGSEAWAPVAVGLSQLGLHLVTNGQLSFGKGKLRLQGQRLLPPSEQRNPGAHMLAGLGKAVLEVLAKHPRQGQDLFGRLVAELREQCCEQRPAPAAYLLETLCLLIDKDRFEELPEWTQVMAGLLELGPELNPQTGLPLMKTLVKASTFQGKAADKLRDQLVQRLKRAMLSSLPSNRVVGVGSLLCFLRHQRITGSQNMSVSESFPTMSAMSQLKTGGGEKAQLACLEAMGALRRGLGDSAAVRSRLYQGLVDAVRKNPPISLDVLEVLKAQLEKSRRPAGAAPPLDLQSGLAVEKSAVAVREPLGELVLALTRVVWMMAKRWQHTDEASLSGTLQTQGGHQLNMQVMSFPKDLGPMSENSQNFIPSTMAGECQFPVLLREPSESDAAGRQRYEAQLRRVDAAKRRFADIFKYMRRLGRDLAACAPEDFALDKFTKLDEESEEGRRLVGTAHQLLSLLEALFDAAFWCSDPLDLPAKANLLTKLFNFRHQLHDIMVEGKLLKPSAKPKTAKAKAHNDSAVAPKTVAYELGRSTGPTVQLATLYALLRELFQLERGSPLVELVEADGLPGWLYQTALDKLALLEESWELHWPKTRAVVSGLGALMFWHWLNEAPAKAGEEIARLWKVERLNALRVVLACLRFLSSYHSSQMGGLLWTWLEAAKSRDPPALEELAEDEELEGGPAAAEEPHTQRILQLFHVIKDSIAGMSLRRVGAQEEDEDVGQAKEAIPILAELLLILLRLIPRRKDVAAGKEVYAAALELCEKSYRDTEPSAALWGVALEAHFLFTSKAQTNQDLQEAAADIGRVLGLAESEEEEAAGRPTRFQSLGERGQAVRVAGLLVGHGERWVGQAGRILQRLRESQLTEEERERLEKKGPTSLVLGFAPAAKVSGAALPSQPLRGLLLPAWTSFYTTATGFAAYFLKQRRAPESMRALAEQSGKVVCGSRLALEAFWAVREKVEREAQTEAAAKAAGEAEWRCRKGESKLVKALEGFDANLIRLGAALRPRVDLMAHRRRVQNFDFKLDVAQVAEIARGRAEKDQRRREREAQRDAGAAADEDATDGPQDGEAQEESDAAITQAPTARRLPALLRQQRLLSTHHSRERSPVKLVF